MLPGKHSIITLQPIYWAAEHNMLMDVKRLLASADSYKQSIYLLRLPLCQFLHQTANCSFKHLMLRQLGLVRVKFSPFVIVIAVPFLVWAVVDFSSRNAARTLRMRQIAH